MKDLHFNLMRELDNPLLNKSLTKNQRKKFTLEDLIEEYIAIRNKHPEARLMTWIKDNGYRYLYRRSIKNHTWHEFKLLCGFNDHNFRK